MDFNKTDYEETVESIAAEVLQDNGIDESDWYERITEEVDSNAYIVYYAGPPVVKEASKNFPTDMQEITSMAGANADFEKLFQVAAYMAMEADVHEKCRELVDVGGVCEECEDFVEDVDDLTNCTECGLKVCDTCLRGDLCPDCEKDLEKDSEGS